MLAGRALVWASEMSFISHHLAGAAAFEKNYITVLARAPM